MNKKWSLYLGRYAGIKVYIHWTFLILIVWIFMIQSGTGHGLAGGFLAVLLILALFACVVLHEFGHALTAQRFHIDTRDITLYPIGGIASLESLPEKPGQELLVALAGPAVNLVIALVLYVILQGTGNMPSTEVIVKAADIQDLPFLVNLLMANVVLAVFNLIPAFPMDGGRVLRALLAFRMDRIRATRIAASIGQFLAMGFVFLGFFYNFWLVFIGLFIYLGAGGEAAFENTRNILAGYRVRDALMTRFPRLSPDDPLEKAVQLLLDGQDQEFLVTREEEVVGVLTRKELIHGLASFGKSSPVFQAMRKDFLTLSPDSVLKDIYSKLMMSDCSVFPVVENGRLAGMVDKENIKELILVRQALPS